ncbi:hypothetical protein [Vibrio phage BUCT006]|nr:hypothetical protein [Vibrio phage BUCT006]
MKKKRIGFAKQKLLAELKKRGRMTAVDIQEFLGYEKKSTAAILVNEMRRDRFGVEIDRESPKSARVYFYTEDEIQTKPLYLQVYEKLACDDPYEWYSGDELKAIFEVSSRRLSRALNWIKVKVQPIEIRRDGLAYHYRLKGEPYGEKE